MEVDGQWKLLEGGESWKINSVKVEIFQTAGESHAKVIQYERIFHVWETSEV